MNGLWAAYAAAFTLGATHALEVDHMVAVTAFVGNKPRLVASAAFGVRWGLGHAVVVLLAGTLLAWSGLAPPERASVWVELLVGIMLVALGVWAARNAVRFHYHDPASHVQGSAEPGHAHLHAHDPAAHPHDHSHADASRRHRHLPALVGAIHGLVGTAPVVALIPVTMLGSLYAAVGYLAAFGIGTMLAMGVYAALAALAVGAASTVRTARIVGLMTAGASATVGLWWVARAAHRL